MPKYEVSVDMPTAGDTELEVHGVGLVKNKGSVVVNLSKEAADQLKKTEGVSVKSAKEGAKAINDPPDPNEPVSVQETPVGSEASTTTQEGGDK